MFETVKSVYLTQRGYKKRDAENFTIVPVKCSGGVWVVKLVEIHESVALLKADSPAADFYTLSAWALVVA